MEKQREKKSNIVSAAPQISRSVFGPGNIVADAITTHAKFKTHKSNLLKKADIYKRNAEKTLMVKEQLLLRSGRYTPKHAKAISKKISDTATRVAARKKAIQAMTTPLKSPKFWGRAIGGKVLGPAGLAYDTLTIGRAGKEGYKAIKAAMDARAEAKASQRKYGSIEAATRTRKELLRKNK